MTEEDKDRTGEGSFAELLARLAQQDSPDAEGERSEISVRVDSLLRALTDAVGAEWPSAEELRELPPAEFASLSRQLSLVIDRLTALRVDLLGGRGRRPL